MILSRTILLHTILLHTILLHTYIASQLCIITYFSIMSWEKWYIHTCISLIMLLSFSIFRFEYSCHIYVWSCIKINIMYVKFFVNVRRSAIFLFEGSRFLYQREKCNMPLWIIMPMKDILVGNFKCRFKFGINRPFYYLFIKLCLQYSPNYSRFRRFKNVWKSESSW